MMKRIAIFVEGQTERIFVHKLLIEIAGKKKVRLELKRFMGNVRPQKTIFPRGAVQPENPTHGVLIYDCGGDESVKSRILEESSSLFSQNYLEVIGLRDLHPKPITDLAKMEAGLAHGIPANTSIVIAVHEIEAWFLADHAHFTCIDSALTQAFIQSKRFELGFDPYIDDPIHRSQPSADLHAIYQLVGKSYTKRKRQVEKTVECLDYAQIYVNLAPNIAKLGEFISKIDRFLN